VKIKTLKNGRLHPQTFFAFFQLPYNSSVKFFAFNVILVKFPFKPNIVNSSNSDIRDFLLAEYEHIANAHFETGKQVSTYFNYYLLILAAPVIIATLIQNKNIEKVVNASTGDDLIVHWIALILLFLISVVGGLICWIVIEIHHDSILYARTVNGIRRYFYTNSGITASDLSKIQVLPTDRSKPDFYSYGHLFIFVLAFGLLNSSFLGGALYLHHRGLGCATVTIPIIYFFVHIIIHYLMSLVRTNRYK